MRKKVGPLSVCSVLKSKAGVTVSRGPLSALRVFADLAHRKVPRILLKTTDGSTGTRVRAVNLLIPPHGWEARRSKSDDSPLNPDTHL